jgi:Bacterial membrane protein YfhO
MSMPVETKKRAGRAGLVLLGILAGQLVLYGASFSGTKILLPLDILAPPAPHNRVVTDPVLEDEPARIFRHAELLAGRLPIWNPYQYAGVPSVSFLSPFALFGALVGSPLILPWLSLILALVAGFGMYVFAHRVLEVGAWPATIAAWCYPVTGFFVLWQSCSLPYPVVWLPWLLCAIHAVLSESKPWALAVLALITMLTLVSGHLDMAGLVLMVGGLFAIWEFFDVFDLHSHGRKAIRRFIVVIVGLALGCMLASPELLPALEYAKTGSRFDQRIKGHEERRPIGLLSLPQLVLPHIYGTSEENSLALFPDKEPNLLETPATGFTGLIASLVLAPLALVTRKRRSLATFLAAVAFLGMAWCLNVPGIVWVMRLPGLNMLSYNRFVFASSFAILALATIGLEKISKQRLRWHWSFHVAVAILAAIAAWCIFRTFVPPETIAVTLPQAIAAGQSMDWVKDIDGVRRVQHWFSRMYLAGAAVSVAALAVWAYLKLKNNLPRALPLSLGLLALAELLFFGYGRASQCDPRLYYPSLGVFDEIARSAPGRTVGYECFQASLLQTHGLFDVRGYDGVDPAPMVDLLDLAAAPESVKEDYAATQYFIPRIVKLSPPGGVQLSPILDLLGVRYVIIHNEGDTDYSVLVNNSALPRAFVPHSVEVEANRSDRLAKLASPLFDPRQVAYVEQPVNLPRSEGGEVHIVEATPQQITMSAKMIERGLVVLADQWNNGWRAYIGDKVVPVLRVDHALSGVIAPAGENTIIFRYQPASLRLGLAAALFATVILIAQAYVHVAREH